MKDWTNTSKRKAACNIALFLVFSLAAATLLAKGPKNQNAQPAAKDHKYKIASGADQVLSSVYDSSTNTIRVSGGGSGGGTVTNVGLSMPGTFSVTGGPVTSSGTLSVNWAQPVSIANGGTGQTGALSAFNALAPSTAAGGLIYGTGLNTYGNLSLGSNGQCLGSNGSTIVWTTCSSGSGITLGGDLSGTSASQAVIGLQGRPVSASAPAGAQVLEWNSSANAWTPTALPAFGTVSSVGLSLPNLFTVSGSPVTSSGTLTGALASQNANLVLASPSGASGVPAFRSLNIADLPSIAFSNLTGTEADAQLANAYSGVGACAANRFTITLARNAAPTCAAALTALTAPAHEWFNAVSAAGVFTASQPSFADISGTATPAQLPSIAFSNLTGSATLAQLPASVAQFTGAITANDCAKWSSSGVLTDAGAACGASGSSATFQVNGANTSSQTPINFQSGGYIAVTNPSAGNIQFNFTGPLAVANGGTGLTTPGASGQCLGSTGTAMVWQSCGSGLGTVTNVGLAAPAGFSVAGSPVSTSGLLTLGMPPGWTAGSLLVGNGANSVTALGVGSSGQCLTSTGATALWGSCGGGALPSGWAQNGGTGAIVAQPISTQDAVPLTVASSLSSGGTADIFDVCQVSPCTPTNKFFWVTWNGNLGFQASNLQLSAASSTSTPPYLYLNGTDGNPGQPYVKYATARLNVPSCAVSAASTGGTVAAGTYYFKCTWVNGAGETTASTEQSVTTTGSTSAITVTAPGAQSSAFGYQIYASTASGSEGLVVPTSANCTLAAQIYNSDALCAPAANATFTATPSGSGAPPATNTTGGEFIDAWGSAADGLGLFLTSGASGADAPADAGLVLPGGTGVNLTSGSATAAGALACLSASNTASQCGANAANTIIGVFSASGQNALVQTTGIATINLASAATTTYNDYACSNAAAGTIVDNGATPCASGQQVGIIAQSNGSAVASVPVFLRFGGGSGGGGSSTTFQANGTALASSSTVNWLTGGPIAVTNTSAGNVQFACPTCIVNNPSAGQTINESGGTWFLINSTSPTTDVFDVRIGGGTNNVIQVTSTGYVNLGLNGNTPVTTSGPMNVSTSLNVDGNQNGNSLNFGSVKDTMTHQHAGNSDISGQITIAASTSGSFTFPAAYASAPVCVWTPTGSSYAGGVWWDNSSATTAIINVTTSGTYTFNYHCMGNPN
ncbi:MAG: beta strand repeat-containing protein [Terriglobia bacterium]